MFGQPQWFKPKSIGYGITPTCWQGWCYTLIWAAVIVLPVFVLSVRGQTFELFIWLIAAIAMLCLDVKQILKAMPQEAKATASCGNRWQKFCKWRKRDKSEEDDVAVKS